jgi:hypothetical protein
VISAWVIMAGSWVLVGSKVGSPALDIAYDKGRYQSRVAVQVYGFGDREALIVSTASR